MLLITAARLGDFPNKAELSFQSLQVIIHLRNTSMARVRALLATLSSKVYLPLVSVEFSFFPPSIASASLYKITVAMVNSAAEVYVNLHLQEGNSDLTL